MVILAALLPALWLAPREREGDPPFVRVYAEASMGCSAPDPMCCPPAVGIDGDFAAAGGGGGGGGLDVVNEGREGGAAGGGGGGGGAGLAGGDA